MMDRAISLLEFLSDNRFHTFEEICEATTMSQPEVSRALADLALEGIRYQIDAGSGCRLLSRFDAWNAQRISVLLGECAQAFTIETVRTTGSTNDDLVARARQGAPNGLVRIAEVQTAGRGRRQRSWYSGPGSAITFSLLWDFGGDTRRLSGLPLAVGVALVRAFRSVGLASIQLKWPNDLLLAQRKLGGILIETDSSASHVVRVVIGIGLNLRLPAAVVDRIDQPATDLDAAGLSVERNELLARVLTELYGVLDTFSRNGFAPMRTEWERMHAYRDKMARLESSAAAHSEGRVIGVDEDGALLLETETGIQAFHAGDLSLRVD